MASTWRTNVLLIALAAICIPAIGWGTRALYRYTYTPGVPGVPPRSWPRAALAPLHQEHPQLLVFLHSQCACSRATLAELARLLARHSDVDATVVVYVPTGGPEGTDLRPAAAAIAGIRLIEDSGAVLARSFGAVTSGQTILYTGNGDLAFRGGITASRGHEGDSAGTEALDAFLDGREPEHHVTPVFGCSLQ